MGTEEELAVAEKRVETLRRQLIDEAKKVSGQIEQLRAGNKHIREGIAELLKLRKSLQDKLANIDEEVRTLSQKRKK